MPIFLLPCLAMLALLSISGCVTPSASTYQPSVAEIADIYAAAIRFRLASTPLSAHRELDIFVDGGVVPGLSERLSEYRVRVHAGGAGPVPPQKRWYWLRRGRVTSEQAFVMLRGTRSPLKGLEFRKRDGKWTVVDDQAMILTYRSETPNHAVQRTTGRSVLQLGVTIVFSEQPYGSSPAVADLESR